MHVLRVSENELEQFAQSWVLSWKSVCLPTNTRVAGTTYRFESERPEKMLLKIENRGVHPTLLKCRSVRDKAGSLLLDGRYA